MHRAKLPRAVGGVALFVLIASLLNGLAVGAPAPAAAQRVFLPSVTHVQPPSIFGLEATRLNSDRGFDLAMSSGTRWIRRNALLWKDVEPVEGGGYNWDAPSLKILEEDFLSASRSAMNLILIVRGSPRWATSPYAADCAPINPAKYEAFARFMAEAVARYSKPPYNVLYWELGNEPDAYIFPEDSVYGCWGVKGDPYYGGEAYGRMLKTVSAAMRQANPRIKILNGGLLLDRPFSPSDPESFSARFFEGLLRAGAGGTFDILSFHSYEFFRTPGQPELGPTNDWRIPYLLGLLERYSVAPKPMIRTESALLCPSFSNECRWAQADMMGRLYARSLRDRLLANIWYAYDRDSFHNTALIEPGDVFFPRPAYFAYRHAVTMLADASYLGPVAGLPQAVEAYRFRKDRATLIVYWSDVPGAHAFALETGTAVVQCTNRDGGELACAPSGGRLSLVATRSPQYVVIR